MTFLDMLRQFTYSNSLESSSLEPGTWSSGGLPANV